jgi:hypothetical protein
MTRPIALVSLVVAVALVAGACGDDDDSSATTVAPSSTVSTVLVGPVGPPDATTTTGLEGAATAVADGLNAIEAHLDALPQGNFHVVYRVEGVEGLDEFEVRWLNTRSRIDATYKGTVTKTYVDGATGGLTVCATAADGRQSCTTGEEAAGKAPPVGVVDPATGPARIEESLRTPRITTSSRSIVGEQADCAKIPEPGGDAAQDLCVGTSGAVLYVRAPSSDGAVFLAEATDYISGRVTPGDITPPPAA